MDTVTTRSAMPPELDDGVLVSPGWLARHLSDPALRVVEVDVNQAAYDEWHIDGAVFWSVYTDLKDPDYQLVDRAALQTLLARSGIGGESTVVFYGYAPALAFWLMKLYGRDARILDCSRDTWRAGGHPWSTRIPEPSIGGGFSLGSEDPRIRAGRRNVQDAVATSAVLLVDVRSEAEYRGECFWPSGGLEPDGRTGHVPTAVHQPLDGLYNDDGSFRPAQELRRVFSSIDLAGDEELITYCTIGGRAATAWVVLTHLLKRDRVRVYDGSWAEWGRLPDLPVEAS